MRLEEDASGPGKIEQLYVEMWFNPSEERREPFAIAFAKFIRELSVAADPMSIGSQWDKKMQSWFHDSIPFRFLYSARKESQTGEWAATMDGFYLIDEK